MGIATFSPFILATHVKDQLPCIVVGVYKGEHDSPTIICVDGDGHFERLELNELVVDWRYNPATELWSGGEISREEELVD